MKSAILLALLLSFTGVALTDLPFPYSQYISEGRLNNAVDSSNLWYSPEKQQIYRHSEPLSDASPIKNAFLLDLDSENGKDEEDRLRHHVQYVMSSTAEQPDSGGRSSNLNIYLTILIAALAAAILS